MEEVKSQYIIPVEEGKPFKIQFCSRHLKEVEVSLCDRMSKIERVLKQNRFEIRALCDKLDYIVNVMMTSAESEKVINFNPEKIKKDTKIEDLMKVLNSQMEILGDDANREAIITDPFDEMFK